MGGVHDGRDVAHARLEIGKRVGPVRHSRASLVEPDQPGEGAKAVQEVRVPPLGPVQGQVRDESRHQHEVDVAGTGDLVGDVEAVPLRVVNRHSGLDNEGRRLVVGGGVAHRRGQVRELATVREAELAEQ